MKILKWLDRNLEEKLMMVLLMAMVLIMGIQVVCRYVFNNSLSWTEEKMCIRDSCYGVADQTGRLRNLRPASRSRR